MKLSPINSYSQNNNCNTKQTFNGKLGDSAYRYVKSLKKEIAKNSNSPDTSGFKMLDEALLLLEDFAKKFHPDTEIQVYKRSEYVFHEDFDGPSWKKLESDLCIEAQNSKVNGSMTLGSIYMGAGHYSCCENPTPKKILEKVKYVVNNSCNPPERVDNNIYESTKNSFLRKVKENQKTSFITKYFVRRKAEKFDKMAQEFHSTPDSLEQVNSHINAWSNFYKEANK